MSQQEPCNPYDQDPGTITSNVEVEQVGANQLHSPNSFIATIHFASFTVGVTEPLESNEERVLIVLVANRFDFVVADLGCFDMFLIASNRI